MKERILIVDDTKSWLVFHRDLIIQIYGDLFDMTFASSAQEALDIIRHNLETPFDIVISDLQMEDDFEPKLAGEWLVENIKQIHSCEKTHVILISGMQNIEQIATRLGVECISKSRLIYNKLLLKYMFEKLMPFLTKM